MSWSIRNWHVFAKKKLKVDILENKLIHEIINTKIIQYCIGSVVVQRIACRYASIFFLTGTKPHAQNLGIHEKKTI